jgi:hypothetical protein
MNINSVNVTGKPLVRAKSTDVVALESQLWLNFPDGYKEYVTKLGEGVLGGFVRIYPPWRIQTELEEWRLRIKKFWFWDKGHKILPKERALECVIIGDTVIGDEIVFHPTRPERLYIMPRGGEKIFDVGNDLWTTIEWICCSGTLVEVIKERDFVPYDSRKMVGQRTPGQDKVADPEGESLDDLVELGRDWAKRHKALKEALRDMKEYFTELMEMTAEKFREIKPTLTSASLVMQGEYPYEGNFVAIYQLRDVKHGLDLGQFIWHKSNGSHGCTIEPNKKNLAKFRKSK